MKKTGSLFLFILFFALSAFAEIKVSAQVDRNQLSLGDPMQLVIRVEGDEDFELEQPVLPSIPGIELINAESGGRQSSTNISFINGKASYVTRTVQEYIYILSPQKEGNLIVPVIDITINGKAYRTDPIKIEVKEEFRNARKTAPKGRPRFPPGFGDDEEANPLGSGPDSEDIFNQLLQRQFGRGFPSPFSGRAQQDEIPSRELNINPNEPFFIYLDLDKTTAYEGEQVTANWYIYTKANIESLDRVKFPDLKGFWKEIIEEVPALQFTEEIVNGQRYRKALLASHALFPIKAGSAIIDEFRIKAKLRNLTQFGMGQPHVVTKVSKRTEIKVLPLPQEGRTQGFSGAVGTYHVTAKTDGDTFPANQPFTVKVRYEGIGNAKLIDLPGIEWPPGLELYDTKSEAKFFKQGNSYKEFEILVIPRNAGTLKIPAMQLTYFDPAQKKYVTESTQELTLNITPGAAAAPSTVAPVAAGPAKAENTKVQPVLQLPEAGFSFNANRLYIYLFSFVAGLLLILLYVIQSLRSLNFESELLASIGTKNQAVEKSFAANDLRKTGAEATNLIYLLVAGLAGQKKADQEIHLLIKEIPLADQQKFLDRINNLFDYFQLLGFSPDEVMRSTLNNKPAAAQVEQLRRLSKEVVDKLRKEDKNNS
jgi:hypothetical protein